LGRLADDYGRYIGECSRRLRSVTEGTPTRKDLQAWRAEEMAIYESLLARDPFLPKTLLPADFPGSRADELHVQFVKAVARPRLARGGGQPVG
jgi:DNA-binding transcriptional regulator PaaX